MSATRAAVLWPMRAGRRPATPLSVATAPKILSSTNGDAERKLQISPMKITAGYESKAIYACGLPRTRLFNALYALQTVPVMKGLPFVMMLMVIPAIEGMAGMAILSSALTEKEIL